MFCKRISIVALCLLLTVVQGCHRHRQTAPEPNVTLTYQVAPQPTRVGNVTITIKMTDRTQKPIDGATVKLEGNMSHAGMAPVVAEATEVGPGRYQANMKLTMAGDWDVLVLLTLPDGSEEDQQFEIKNVAPA